MTKTRAVILLAGLSVRVFAGDVSRTEGPRKGGEPPLHQAAVKGDVKQVERLLDGGAAVNGVNDRGQTALHEAAGQSPSRVRVQKRVVALLLDRGASANAVDEGGGTPLHNAAARGNFALVTLLLDRGAKTEVADKNGMTPLMWAAAGENRGGAVELLLKRGARVDSVNKNGQTPLFLANANKRTATAAILRSHGAR